MIVFFALLCFAHAASDDNENSFDAINERIKNDSYKIDGSLHSGILVLFYSDSGNETKPFAGRSFVIPTDVMTKLKINNFYDLIGNKTNDDIYCRVLVNYRYSEPHLVYSASQIPKLVSVQVNLDDDSHIESVDWDTDCNDCASSDCLADFCAFKITEYDGTTCAEARKSNKEACGLILFVGWKGQAKARYLKSYLNLPSHFSKYSLKGQFLDSAADFEQNWLSF
ncbi:hypothetical protein CL6EHI_064670 [Entamoeba histolytica]|uniref:Uncharacterized protein n=3 Tax=Entamoeba histolytica TaxID=5759 RepID=C4M0D3_ENTH1|nr:hypothetical protein EHI_064670 [Entamoeba histolytica HM-1:IMSS]EAL45803.2 hypothetical protein EHI_064670 [Entamoeba histolytica HM-1:IMSS]EMD47857.1 Hypothetical protein EHI5A_062080 [Entamoeba histolytica KU27]GAT94616.1 hypothetical protein CL6EHI_064670 [Entamoeba histolytica]|eukprot:XP_651191.2 hypothetical protein EHI_064670 [Entamoeba histolytica HM-1:IMSS]